MCLGGKTSAYARFGVTLTTSLCLNAWEKDAVQVLWVMEQCNPWASAVKACALILSIGKKSYLCLIDCLAWLVVGVLLCAMGFVAIVLGLQIIFGFRTESLV